MSFKLGEIYAEVVWLFSSIKYFNEFKTEYFPSEPITLITFLSFFSGFLSLSRACLILLRSKFTVFLNNFF